MSHVFTCGDEIIWDPSNRVARTFLGLLKTVAATGEVDAVFARLKSALGLK